MPLTYFYGCKSHMVVPVKCRDNDSASMLMAWDLMTVITLTFKGQIIEMGQKKNEMVTKVTKVKVNQEVFIDPYHAGQQHVIEGK